MAYLFRTGVSFFLPWSALMPRIVHVGRCSELILETNSVVTRSAGDWRNGIRTCVCCRLGRRGGWRSQLESGPEFRLKTGVTARLLENRELRNCTAGKLARTLGGSARSPGVSCATFEDLERASVEMCNYFPTRLVLKEAMGVSGKGLVVLDSQGSGLERALAMLRRKAKPGIPCRFVLEKWIDKLNGYSITKFLVTPDGDVRLLCIKEAVTRNGVHMGHYSPPLLAPRQRRELL